MSERDKLVDEIIRGRLKLLDDDTQGIVFGPVCKRCGIRVRMPCHCPWYRRIFGGIFSR